MVLLNFLLSFYKLEYIILNNFIKSIITQMNNGNTKNANSYTLDPSKNYSCVILLNNILYHL